MDRRKALTVLAPIGLAGCLDEAEGFIDGFGEEEGSLDGKEFGRRSPGFESIDWVNLNELRITFEADHDIDFFSINHDFNPDHDDALHVAEAPDFSGPVGFRLIDEIESSDTVYPTREFRLVAYKGEYTGFINFTEENLGHVNFVIPPEIAPPEKFDDP